MGHCEKTSVSYLRQLSNPDPTDVQPDWRPCFRPHSYSPHKTHSLVNSLQLCYLLSKIQTHTHTHYRLFAQNRQIKAIRSSCLHRSLTILSSEDERNLQHTQIVSHREHRALRLDQLINWTALYTATTAVHNKNYKEHLSTMCGQNSQIYSVNFDLFSGSKTISH